MCTTSVTHYVHHCNGFKVVLTTSKHQCPYCKQTGRELASAGRAYGVRTSTGFGGLTGRPFASGRGSQGRS